MEGKYLITTDHWFYAPDGRQYKAVFGECKILKDDVLGIKTNRASTNWYVQVGNDVDNILIAGCQIHYAIKCESVDSSKGYTEDDKGREHIASSRIYIPGKIENEPNRYIHGRSCSDIMNKLLPSNETIS